MNYLAILIIENMLLALLVFINHLDKREDQERDIRSLGTRVTDLENWTSLKKK